MGEVRYEEWPASTDEVARKMEYDKIDIKRCLNTFRDCSTKWISFLSLLQRNQRLSGIFILAKHRREVKEAM